MENAPSKEEGEMLAAVWMEKIDKLKMEMGKVQDYVSRQSLCEARAREMKKEAEEMELRQRMAAKERQANEKTEKIIHEEAEEEEESVITK